MAQRCMATRRSWLRSIAVNRHTAPHSDLPRTVANSSATGTDFKTSSPFLPHFL
jgi:hypothetical protein